MELTDLPLGDKRDLRQMPSPPSTDPRDIACVRFSAEQAEEIMASDYTLKIFHATRIESLSMKDIVDNFGEPGDGVAQVILDRLVRVGVLEVKADSKYFTAYPGNFPNFTDHTYDLNLELNKDARVFKLMKENAGDREYWQTQSYFSTDGFFSDEQALEVRKRLMDLKFFIKNALKANMEEGTLKGKTFRRHKFYDLVLGSFLALFVFVGGKADASNDPGGQIAQTSQLQRMQNALKWAEQLRTLGKQFSSNDPGAPREQTASLWQSSLVWPASSSDGDYGLNFADNPAAISECNHQLSRRTLALGGLNSECRAILYNSLLDVCYHISDENYCSDADALL